MDVELYVYDLSKGMAKALSVALLGTYIDAVYHTAIVFEGVEYVYDGGLKRVRPGMTHLGKPMEIINLGKTELPMEVIMDYLDSLKSVYTAEAYDLWKHNCNNFSNDLATFLLGKGIPSHITNLPDTVLNTPFGRMMKPQFDAMVKEQQTGAGAGGALGIQEDKSLAAPPTTHQLAASVKVPSTTKEFDTILKSSQASCVLIFFTSKTCAPCKAYYPLFDELAQEAGAKATLIKVDISVAYDVGARYQVQATPTFMSFIRGEKIEQWSGGGPAQLRGNFNMLMQMAYPPHPHQSLRLPTLLNADKRAVLFSKVPPMDKLLAKMGDAAKEPSVLHVRNFIDERNREGAAEATLPDLDHFTAFLHTSVKNLPPTTMFAVIDLLRIAMVDLRFSGYYAEEKDHATIVPILNYVNDQKDCPYNLRLVTLHLACNLFSTSLYVHHILACESLRTPIVTLLTTSLLDDKHHSVRVAAASLIFNIAVANSKCRIEDGVEALPEGDQVELAASILEAIAVEEGSEEALKGYLLALGYLVYCAPKDGEMIDLLKSMDAQSSVAGKANLFPNEPLVKEIGEELLGKGL